MLVAHQHNGISATRSRRGTGILDAVVGSVILLLVVVGISTQLVASSLSIGTSQASFVATSLANSTIVAQQADMGNGTVAADTTTVQISWTDPTVNTSTVVVAGTTFSQYTAGGWCALTGAGSPLSPASWGHYTGGVPAHPGYWVASKVSWGDGTTYREIVGQATPPSGTTPPATSWGCPVELP
jgi:hypothetical protein